MKATPRLTFTVTNDLVYDQRMIRICTSLANAGYQVTLVGRRGSKSIPLQKEAFRQRRIRTWFSKGFGFYAEYNIRLFFYLLFTKTDLLCAIDLDTILPVYWVSRLRKKKRVYDAHELFCEMQEIVERPRIYRFWKRLERMTVPHFKVGYTVNQPIAEEFKNMYGVDYGVVRNVPFLRELEIPEKTERYILYQGAVNEGRSFDTLIPAMLDVPARLHIAGDGNYMQQVRELVKKYGLEEKVILLGKIKPADLRQVTRYAWAGVTLFEDKGKSNYFSLANRYFDYLHAGIPQLCVDYPVYRELNNSGAVALLTSDLRPESLAAGLNQLLNDESLYRQLQANCLIKRNELNWQQEEKTLLNIYQRLFNR